MSTRPKKSAARLAQPQHGRVEKGKPQLGSEQSIAAAAAETAALRESHTQLLLLPDGRVLAHNLTPAMAELLQQLDPDDQLLRRRCLSLTSVAAKPAGDSSLTES